MADIGCSTNAAIAFDFLVGRGLTLEQAAGVVGNLQFESGLDPALAVMDTNGKMSRGIAMWQPERWQNLLAFAGSRNPLSIDVQLEFLWAELPSYGLSTLRSASHVEDAVVVFQNQFEKPAAALAHTDRRIALAQAALYALPSCQVPIRSKAGVIAATVGVIAVVATATFGVLKWVNRPAPEPDPPLYYPSPFYRRRPF